MAYDAQSKGASILRQIGLMALGLVALVFFVLRQPARLLGLRKFVSSAFQEGNQIWLSAPEHRGRIVYSVVATTPGLDRENEVQDLVRDLVEDRDWASLSDLLEEWDTARAATPDQWRLIHIATQTVMSAMAGLEEMKQICAPQADPRITSDAVSELIALFRANPHAYALAALAIQSRVQQAWDVRGGDYADAVPEHAWDWIEDQMEQAFEMLELAGIDTRNSPLLFNARLSLLPFYHDADRVILRWYEDAVKSDPGDSAPHDTIGNFLLPRWFGDYQMIETAARQGASWSEAAMGMGAYAVVYNAALDSEKVPIHFLDMELYQQSVKDLVRYRGSNPSHIAFLSQFLHTQSQWGWVSGMGEEDRAHWDRQTRALRSLGLRIVEDHLSAIHPGSWDGGEDGALDMISLAMGQELEDGANLVMGPKGIEAVFAEDTLTPDQ